MKKIAAFGLLLSAIIMSVTAHADEVFHCAFGEQERVISVVYEVEGEVVPCEVHYVTADGLETPWSAQNEEGFCEEKAEEFVEQHREWGWRCDLLEADEPAPESESEPESEWESESEY